MMRLRAARDEDDGDDGITGREQEKQPPAPAPADGVSAACSDGPVYEPSGSLNEWPLEPTTARWQLRVASHDIARATPRAPLVIVDDFLSSRFARNFL